MATLFNNTEITNAFFNGTELDKIYFNGVLVFEKGGKYKRRIMVGDNLKGKIIISDFPTNFKEELINIVSPDVTQVNVISSTNDQSLFFGLYVKKYDHPTYGTPTTYVVAGRVDSNRNLYIYTVEDNYEGINNYDNYQVQSTEDIVISEINDSAIYRHIFIEDENIRPLEVGDIILDNTIFYFTFPDNFYTEDASTSRRIVVVQEDGNEIGWQLELIYYDENKVRWNFYKSGTTGGGSTRYAIYDPSGTTWKNASKKIASDMVVDSSSYGTIYCRGKVTQVIKENIAYEHILVDTRTLGTSGYKRRIMVGDNLRGKTLYGNFLSNIQDYIYVDPDLPGLTRTVIGFDNNIEIVDWCFENQYFIQGSQACFNDETYDIWQNKGGSYLPNTFKEDQDYIVDYVLDNPIYRCLFIEDHKIRPLQVGDKIVAGTKFYFNFPDDFWKNYEFTGVFFDTDYSVSGGISIVPIGNSTQGVEIIITDAEGNPNQTKVYVNGTESFIQYSGGMKNLSSYIFNTSGKIISINENNILYPYILVDITTLG